MQADAGGSPRLRGCRGCLRGCLRGLRRNPQGASLRQRCSMDYSWLIRWILTGLFILAIVVFGIIRLGFGTAAAAGLGHLPMSKVPARLRRFLFGERTNTAHKLEK
jgi:hypothetical protein